MPLVTIWGHLLPSGGTFYFLEHLVPYGSTFYSLGALFTIWGALLLSGGTFYYLEAHVTGRRTNYYLESILAITWRVYFLPPGGCTYLLQGYALLLLGHCRVCVSDLYNEFFGHINTDTPSSVKRTPLQAMHSMYN